MNEEQLAVRLAAIEEKLDQVLEFRDLVMGMAAAKIGPKTVLALLGKAKPGKDV